MFKTKAKKPTACKKCNEAVTLWANKCPHCGVKNPTMTFKDYVLGSIMLVVIVTAAISFLIEEDTSDEALVSLDKNKIVAIVNDSSLTEQQRIERLISYQFAGETNLEQPKIIKVAVGGFTDNFTVLVDINASDNITKNLRIHSLKNDMADIHKALFTNFDSIHTVIVTAHFPGMDQYGNAVNMRVYRTLLTKEIADNIHWQQEPVILRSQVMPQLWKAYQIHPEFQ